RKALTLKLRGGWRRVQNLPERKAAFDRRVTLLAFVDGRGKPRVVLCHLICHPVFDPPGAAGTDVPGAVRGLMARQHGDDLGVIWLQGFTGDIRPNLIHRPSGAKDRLLEMLIGSRFRPSVTGDRDHAATLVFWAIEKALASAEPCPEAPLEAVRDTLPVPTVSGRDSGRSLDLTAWRLAPAVRLLFANGEMLSGLAPHDGTISVGYSNGMIGYVAPDSEPPRGGYEIDGFLRRFGLEERFAPDIGSRFLAVRREMLGRVDRAGAAG
ncbi:MAG: hypothetical protein ACM3N5_15430, partial [Candidatus Eiseniibacteriota bacterium]